VDIVELFTQLGVLEQARWKSKATGYVARIERSEGPLLHISIEMPFYGGSIPDTLERTAFLRAYVPLREKT